MAHIVLSMDREQPQATGELLGVWVPETSQETNTSTGPRMGNASRGSRPEQIFIDKESEARQDFLRLPSSDKMVTRSHIF